MRAFGRIAALAAGALAVALAAALPAAAQRGDRAADARPKAKADDGTPQALAGAGGGLVVGGVEVDVGGKTPNDARLNGWREAQRRAWPALWTRMSGQKPETAPRLADSALDSMVSAIEVEREQIGPTRYVARLAVVFDRVRAASYLGNFAALATSPPLLLLPVLQDAGTRMAHEGTSEWLAAWTRLRAGESPIDYIRIQPAPGDVILLNAWQAERRHVFIWRNLVDRYQVADVLIPELILERTWVGGPLTALLIVRFGPSGRELGRARLANKEGDVAALMDAAVRQADSIYVTALRAGNLLPDPDLFEAPPPVADVDAGTQEIGTGFEASGGIRVRVATPDDAALSAIERAVRATPGVAGVRLQSFSLGGDSTLEILTDLSPDALRQALDRQGLRLDGNVLRRRAAGEAPLAPAVDPDGQGAPVDLLPTDGDL